MADPVQPQSPDQVRWNARVSAIAAIAERLPEEYRKPFLREAFVSKISTDPVFQAMYPQEAQQKEIALRFGVHDPYTRQLVDSFKPKGWTPEDAGSVLSNPHATWGEKGWSALASGLSPFMAAGKALTPPIARGRLEGPGSLFPSAFSLPIEMGRDIAPHLGMSEDMGALAGGVGGGITGILAKWPRLRVPIENMLRRQFTTAPTLGSLRGQFQTGRTAGRTASPSVPQQGVPPTVPPPTSPTSGVAAEVRPRFRYGPNGIELLE